MGAKIRFYFQIGIKRLLELRIGFRIWIILHSQLQLSTLNSQFSTAPPTLLVFSFYFIVFSELEVNKRLKIGSDELVDDEDAQHHEREH